MIARKILIIEDEQAVSKYLRLALEADGYVVFESIYGQEGLLKIKDLDPDLVILDLGLPDVCGDEVLSSLRVWSKVPVLVLTARTSEKEKIALLDSGADDYITKPFGTNELMARLRALVRRGLQRTGTTNFTSGPLFIDFIAQNVFIRGQPIKLTDTEYRLLKFLASGEGRLITQRQILLGVWGASALDSSHYLRVYITMLRKKLEDNPATPQLLITEAGVGYRLMVLE